MNVNGKDDTPYIMEKKMFETTNQIIVDIQVEPGHGNYIMLEFEKNTHRIIP